jgi:hypothetical protein
MSLVQMMVIWISRKSEGSGADPPASRALSLLQQSAVRAVSSEQLYNMQQSTYDQKCSCQLYRQRCPSELFILFLS